MREGVSVRVRGVVSVREGVSVRVRGVVSVRVLLTCQQASPPQPLLEVSIPTAAYGGGRWLNQYKSVHSK